MNYIINYIGWYKLLRNLGYSRIISIDFAAYNAKYWYPEGEWPFKMKKIISTLST
jgi:hypothetical protein